MKLDNKSFLTNTRFIQILTGSFYSFYLKYKAHVKKCQCNCFNIKKCVSTLGCSIVDPWVKSWQGQSTLGWLQIPLVCNVYPEPWSSMSLPGIFEDQGSVYPLRVSKVTLKWTGPVKILTKGQLESNLNAHIQTQTGENPFYCQECSVGCFLVDPWRKFWQGQSTLGWL